MNRDNIAGFLDRLHTLAYRSACVAKATSKEAIEAEIAGVKAALLAEYDRLNAVPPVAGEGEGL